MPATESASSCTRASAFAHDTHSLDPDAIRASSRSEAPCQAIGGVHFESGLPAAEVHDRLANALDVLRSAESRVVLWFAEVLNRKLYRELGYSSIMQYAQLALGFSQAKTYQFLRLAESLKKLPVLHKEIAADRMPWTKAREIVKVASSRNEKRWIDEARRSSSRALEAKVRQARETRKAKSARAPEQCLFDLNPKDRDQLAPDLGKMAAAQAGAEDRPVEVDTASAGENAPLQCEAEQVIALRFSPEDLARFESLIEAAIRSRCADGASRREAIVLAALEDLLAAPRSAKCPEGSRSRPGDAGQGSKIAARVTRVQSVTPKQIVIYKCEVCGKGTLQSARGLLPLSPAALAAAECDSRTRHLNGSDGERRNRATIPPAIRHSVLDRDGHRCQAPGCGRARFLEVHHLVARSARGTNRPEKCSRSADPVINLYTKREHSLSKS